MIKTILTATVLTTASLTFAASAQATDFYAAPMNSGPAMVTGLGPIGDIANVALLPVNTVTQPLLVGPAPAPVAEAPMTKRHRHHYMKHAMKKKMM